MTAADDAGRMDLDAVEARDACASMHRQAEIDRRALLVALRAAREAEARVRAVAATVLALAVDHGMGECDDGCTDELAKLTAALDGTS